MIVTEDKLLDLELQIPTPLMSKKWKVRILSWGFFFAIATIVLVYFSYLRKFDNDRLAALQPVVGAFAICLFIMPLIGMLLALLFSLFPIKGYNYKRKYWAFALSIILVLQLFICSIYAYRYLNPPPKTSKDIQLK